MRWRLIIRVGAHEPDHASMIPGDGPADKARHVWRERENVAYRNPRVPLDIGSPDAGCSPPSTSGGNMSRDPRLLISHRAGRAGNPPPGRGWEARLRPEIGFTPLWLPDGAGIDFGELAHRPGLSAGHGWIWSGSFATTRRASWSWRTSRRAAGRTGPACPGDVRGVESDSAIVRSPVSSCESSFLDRADLPAISSCAR